MKFVPNLLTLLNLSLGTLALINLFTGDYAKSAVYILLAVVLDGMDGRLARRLQVASEMGKQMDSLSDLVSFGVAPALLVFVQVFSPTYGYSLISVAVTVLFVICGAYRLARFNVLNITDYFVGVPITVAGGLVGALSFLASILPAMGFLLILPVLSFLMISSIKVPKW
ncbi:MAG TPA: CDP-diacylglycerol--serine O-phosphatidyltransferase [Syntrophothermus lipocalidus]|uniref:CDP-diacylglycerol--serine O-phosphatidyltransferase n=1 Tax=Syntrophothermus sp. TaxID=2736299 RepID=UPI001845707B|nr:CDP-diacylglycerol--serine O-phosphatidyltransferase [Syntrophothermus sp.]NSW82997.1 CDP-diacylglycerol--serine O-phosphatidyltransferase [Syntrophothermus sp.]HHV75774.1 CDP-diacylglycerol--serine O-phosphatidyltransferase [Syntrophothermus lipocalidus]HOV43505.1 CDP-diacylglycerol--serine O-phosphatidyltransferase [Syntrophothermus lipocalidus]